MKKEAITFLGVGDVDLRGEHPENTFQHVVDVLRSADIAVANVEQPLSDKGHPNPTRAAYSSSRNIPALVYAGFDGITLANNHSGDWGQEAMVDSIDRLKEAGLPVFGVGKNLTEAHQPLILERKGTKVGFLAYCSVHPKGYEAEDDRPGVAQVRAWTIYDQVDIQPGTPPRIVTIPHKDDLAVMVEDIRKLKAQVDVVVILFHWGIHLLPRVIPMYCFDLGHAAIDAGADLILGTHTHILKGIEDYKGKVIFYSTSFFASTKERGKSQMLSAQSLKYIKELDELFGITGPRPEVNNSLIAKAIIEDGEIKKASYIPCHINEQGAPEIVTRSDARGWEVYNYMEDISRSECLTVRFSWDGDEVAILTQAAL